MSFHYFLQKLPPCDCFGTEYNEIIKAFLCLGHLSSFLMPFWAENWQVFAMGVSWVELGIIISAGQSIWEVFLFLVRGGGGGWQGSVGRCEVATSWGGKINWVVIRIKLCWSDYKLMLPMRLEKAFSEFF